jgi:hypothetical protein
MAKHAWCQTTQHRKNAGFASWLHRRWCTRLPDRCKIVSSASARRLGVAPWTRFLIGGGANRKEKLASERVATFGKPNAMNGDAVQIPDRDKEKWKLKRRKLQMANQEKAKCAHIPCLCEVAPGQKYCSEACRDAGTEDVEVACQCDHASCPLTV